MPENAETKEPEQVIKLRLATGENVDYVTSAILSGLRPPPDMTISEWAAITHIHAKLIRSRLVAGWTADEIFGDGRKTQPCWGCKRACGGCSWSQDFTPIPGWVATETLVGSSKCGREYKSYQIEKCPEFEPDEPR